MKTIYLIRHGLSTANDQGIVQGHQDFPLSPEGEKQAFELAAFFRKNRIEFDIVASSDLTRARKTAEIVCGSLDVVTESLREMHLGVWEGRQVDELIAQSEMWEMWKHSPLLLKIEGAESLFDVQARAFSFIEEMCRNREFNSAAVFTHGGVIGLLLCGILNESLNNVWQHRHENTAFTVLEYSDTFIVKKVNQSPHLVTSGNFFEKWKFVEKGSC
ncbi:MAG: histidine phosphatase family protein [Candidatus Wallbacteria bacterium]|nr:histidine phosphatase family protein [Candidatus Wallbacteria bacterium]